MGGIVKAVGNVFSTILGGGAPKPPTPAAPTVMPTPDDDAMKKAKRQSMAEQMSRGGRQSTILTDSDKLGGG